MDFYVEHTIHASPEDVAAIMFNPDREGEWTDKGGGVEHLTPGPLAVGSRVRHKAGVLGWEFSFTTEVKAFDPLHRLEVEIVGAPDHDVIIYQIAPTAGGCIASIHVRDQAMKRLPQSVWARKKQAQDNLTHLAAAVAKARAA